jgi:peptidoglycan-N-acetylglucosamine deacetylase
MVRRAVYILIAIGCFGAGLAALSACGVGPSHHAAQPFGLLAAVPQVAREYAALPPSQAVPLPAAVTPPTPQPPPLTVLTEGAPALNEIALTFDDGPHPGFTEPLLKILADHRIKATFFLVGRMAELAGDLVRQEAAAGHEIGNHTYSHICLKTSTPELANTELRRCNAVIESLTGEPVRICRPPGGVFDRNAIAIVHQLNMMTVLWTCDPADYEDIPGPEIVARTIPGLSPGGVVLLHDGIQGTLDALPQIIAACEARGFKFVTCSEMAQHRASGRAAAG